MMNKIVFALAMASAAVAAPLNARQDACQDAYKACIAAGTPEVACSCTLTACVGEDNARNREYCASATANLPKPTSTGIPGGCNPAHPGSCPSSYFTYTTATATAAPAPTFTSISGIPAPPPTPNPKAVEGKTWTIKDMTRYCGEKNDGCDYNFAIEADGKTERCTVIRMPGSNAATESWSDQPCTSGSNFKVSWGYVANPAPAFAVVTVVNGKELAWFGVSDINGKPVTTAPSSPFGSGQFGNLGPEQVYTY
ncbi:uncharacterized protein N0V96_009858 [Colletotrichum fioriniae]|uniref:uncharacterized protein n=1 Tax=Colletotrichum fioriniae TaxID=710243 RepID=UPI0032DAA336|nr:hypothetical protein N0V96_009858 [Colletotrichum fioriniae]